MVDKYEYHKQNEYPGERVAEKKRVAEREEESDKKADARVAENGRQNAKKMDVQRAKSESKARSVNKSTNRTYTAGLVIIVGLFLLLLVLAAYSIINMRKQTNEINDLNSQVSQLNVANNELISENNRLLELTDEIDTKSPTILYGDPITEVYPANTERFVDSDVEITVTFSEDMDPASINKNTFTLRQRQTPEFGDYMSQEIVGTVTYNENNRQATFVPDEGLFANQVYGDVFTATITTGVQDVEGNHLENDYKWSFTTTGYSFNTGTTTSKTN